VSTMTTEQTSRTFRVALTVLLLAAAAFCSLQTFRWMTSYSAWYGLPSEAQNTQMAGFWWKLYLGILVLLEAATVAIVWSLVELRQADMSEFLKQLARFAMAVGVTVAGTGVFMGLMVFVFRKIS
jgi:hypothetical protein